MTNALISVQHLAACHPRVDQTVNLKFFFPQKRPVIDPDSADRTSATGDSPVAKDPRIKAGSKNSEHNPTLRL